MGSASRAVVVTGASSGIGADAARYLHDKGLRVFATVRKEADAEKIRAFGNPRLEPLLLDVTDTASVAKAADAVRQRLQGDVLVGLVNNAGIAFDAPLEFVDVASVRAQLEVNVIAPVVVCQAFLPLLRQGRGRIVNVSSLNGRVAMPYSGPYCMSKFALEAFTDCLRQELVQWGLHVAAVLPGAVDTPIWQKGLETDWGTAASSEALALYGSEFEAYRTFVRRSAREAAAREPVSRAIFHALTSTRPRTRYIVGTDARLFALLAWVLPDRVVDWLTRKVMGLGAARAT